MALFDDAGTELAGGHAVVVGPSWLVLAGEFFAWHRFTRDLAAVGNSIDVEALDPVQLFPTSLYQIAG
jgi:hypothetical protein